MFHWTMKTLTEHFVSLERFLVLPEILNSGLVNSAWALERITRTGLVLDDDLSVEAVALKFVDSIHQTSSKCIKIDVHEFLLTNFTGVYKNIGKMFMVFSCSWSLQQKITLLNHRAPPTLSSQLLTHMAPSKASCISEWEVCSAEIKQVTDHIMIPMVKIHISYAYIICINQNMYRMNSVDFSTVSKKSPA